MKTNFSHICVNILLVIFSITFILSCSKSPDEEYYRAHQIGDGKVDDYLSQCDQAKKLQDKKFALFRSYGESRRMYLAIDSVLDASKGRYKEKTNKPEIEKLKIARQLIDEVIGDK